MSAAVWSCLLQPSMLRRQLNSFQCSVLESSQETKEVLSSSSLLAWKEPWYPAAPVGSAGLTLFFCLKLCPRWTWEPTFCFCRLQSISNSHSLPYWNNLWLWATGRKGLDAQVAFVLAKWNLKCSIEGRTVFGVHWGQPPLLGTCMGYGGAKRPLSISLCWAEEGGVLPVELHQLVVAISHSP